MVVLLLLIMIAPTLTLPIIEQIETRAQKIQSHGIPKSLSSRDRLHTTLRSPGSSQPGLIIYTSILNYKLINGHLREFNEECLLKRYDEFGEICETVQRTKCDSG